MLQAPVFFVVQSFNGDASGNLRGDVSLFASEADASVTGAPMGPGSGELCRMNFSTVLVAGKDPLETITEALIAKFPAGALVAV